MGNYTSFGALQNSTVQFDLSNVAFRTKEHGNTSAEHDTEVSVSYLYPAAHQTTARIAFSIRKDICDKMIKENGAYWTGGVVTQGVFSRLYLIPSDKGYKISRNPSQTTRGYLQIPVDDESTKVYVGKHKMQYDDHNEAYYITVNE
jgi:hypothetical protein